MRQRKRANQSIDQFIADLINNQRYLIIRIIHSPRGNKWFQLYSAISYPLMRETQSSMSDNMIMRRFFVPRIDSPSTF